MLSGHLKTFAFALLALPLFAASPARAQTHASPPPMTVKDPGCVAMVDGRCGLRAVHRAIEMTVAPDRRLQIILKGTPAPDGGPSPIVILMPVSDDLDGRIRAGELTDDEATRVWTDLANFEGTLYSLPDLAVLKSELGFPAEAVMSDVDLTDLCRAHIQRSLGVSAVTAAYIAERMGIEATPIDDLVNERGELRAGAAPELVAPTSAQADDAPVPAADDDKAGSSAGVTSIRN